MLALTRRGLVIAVVTCGKRVGRMTVIWDDNESNLLRHSWERHAAETLDTYLVSGVEDPRINVQSILTRGLLCDALFPGRFARLIDEELRFGFVMTWLLTHLQLGIKKQSIMAAITRDDLFRVLTDGQGSDQPDRYSRRINGSHWSASIAFRFWASQWIVFPERNATLQSKAASVKAPE